MGTVTLLLGRTRYRRRRALRVEQYAGTDVLGRPNFLFVTDSARKKQTVQEEFVQYRNGASFLPEVATLAELQDRLAGRYVGDRPPWSTAAIALWLTEHFSAFAPPWLVAAGPADRVAAHVAAAFERWERAGRPRLPGRRGRQVEPFLRDLAAALDRHPARVTRHTALRALVHRLGAPGEALTAWLRRFGLVVVDDVIAPPALDREVLFALTRAWAAAGANVVVALECGVDAPEAEDRYFGVEDGGERLSPTLAATADLRRAALDALLADGTADVFVAGPEFGVSRGPTPAEEADPTDTWGTERVAHAEGLSLETWPDPAVEVRGIAHRVRHLLDGGVPPGDVWVAFPGLPAYAGLVRRTFAEVGVPFTLSRGGALVSQPGARALVRALAAALRPEEPAPLLAAFVDLDLPGLPAPEVAAMARRLREAGVREAPPPEWMGRCAGGQRPALEAELARLRGVIEAATAEGWVAAVESLAVEWGLREGQAGRDAAARPGAGAAIRAANALAAEARSAGLRVSGEALTRLWLADVESATLSSRFAPGAAVAVVGMLELRGIHPPHLFIGGLLAEDFPGTTANDWLFDGPCRDALGGPQPMPEARYLLGSAVRNTLAHPGRRLTLSWPRQRDGKLALCSPVVEELLAVRVAEGELRQRVVARRAPEGRFGAAQWMRAAAAAPVRPPWMKLLRPDLEALAAPVLARREPAYGRFDGRTGLRHEGGQIAVTAFEAYLACPARYFYGSLLRLEGEETFSLDLPASSRGRLLHRVLQRFFQTLMIAGVPSLQEGGAPVRAQQAALLATAARAELAGDRDVAALPAVQRELLVQQWCSGLDDGGPAGLFRAWLDAEAASPPSRVAAVELACDVDVGPLRLHGRADRVDDLGADRRLVLDHKTGGLPNEVVAAGLRVQGVLYGRAVATPERPLVAGGFASFRGAEDVARGAWAGPAALLAEVGAPPRKSLVTDGEAGAALDAWLTASAARLAAGHFHPTTATPEQAGCGYCAFATICRVDPDRAAENRTAGDPDTQVPFGAQPAPAEASE
jgi:RecB family exonuclease